MFIPKTKKSKHISVSHLKILKPKEDFFVWKITDKCFGSIISDAFELFDEKLKFYISIQLINGAVHQSPISGVQMIQQQRLQ